MKEKVELLCSEIKESISKAKTVNELNNLKVEYMGKKGIITELQSGIKDATDKKEYGMQVNTVRTTFNENYEAKLQELNTLEINKKLEELINLQLFDDGNYRVVSSYFKLIIEPYIKDNKLKDYYMRR